MDWGDPMTPAATGGDEEAPNGEFYCAVCRTYFPTDGNAPASESDLENELNEHLAEYHD